MMMMMMMMVALKKRWCNKSIVSIHPHYHEEVHWFMAGAAFDTVSMTHSMLERQWSKTWRGADEEGSNPAAQGLGKSPVILYMGVSLHGGTPQSPPP